MSGLFFLDHNFATLFCFGMLLTLAAFPLGTIQIEIIGYPNFTIKHKNKVEFCIQLLKFKKIV